MALTADQVRAQLAPSTPAHITDCIVDLATGTNILGMDSSPNLRSVAGGGDFVVDIMLGTSTFGRWDQTTGFRIVESFKHSWAATNVISVTFIDKTYTVGRIVNPDGTTINDEGRPSTLGVKLDDRVRVQFKPEGSFSGFVTDIQSNSPELNTADAGIGALRDAIAALVDPLAWLRIGLFVMSVAVMAIGFFKLTGLGSTVVNLAPVSRIAQAVG